MDRDTRAQSGHVALGGDAAIIKTADKHKQSSFFIIKHHLSFVGLWDPDQQDSNPQTCSLI